MTTAPNPCERRQAQVAHIRAELAVRAPAATPPTRERYYSSTELGEVWDVLCQMNGPENAHRAPGLFNLLLQTLRLNKEERRDLDAARRTAERARWKALAEGRTPALTEAWKRG